MAVQRLFSALIGRPWSIENETEALSLLPQLSDQKSPSARLAEQLQFLHRFVDAMLQLREVASRNALQAEEHPEELTRTELAERHGKIRKEAIEGLIASLVAGKSNLPLRGDDLQDEKSDSEIALPEATLHDWLDIERMYLDLKLDRNHGSVADECWKLLERLTADDEAVDEDTELTDEQFSAMSLAAQLKQRALTMITYLSVRKSAPDALRTRLKTFIAEKIAESDEGETGWHSQMITLLIALDAPEELERLLRDWIQGDAYPVAWQLMLGRLLAEQGTLDEAITLYESVQRKQQLSPSDYSMLADWYMATDRRDDYRRARIETFKVMEEWRLQQWIGQKRQPWYQTDVPLPTELDEDVLFAFQALFEKSSQPGNYVYELQSFYTACRDFRLLNMVPDAVIGRTPQQVYSFLTGLNNSLFNELRNEATADELLQRIEKLRAQLVLLPPRGEKVAAGRMRGGVLSSAANPVATPNSQPPTRPAGIHSPGQGSGNGSTSLDLRALDLLEAMIERKASEVLNQPAPHAAKAVSALQRSFRHEWADGEIRQMAKLLAQMGTITSQPIADERLRQLRLLHDLTEPGTGDRVHLSENLAHVLFYNHHRQDDAIAVQSAAIREYAQIHPDGWPAHLNDPLSNYVNLLEQVRRYASAETLLREHIAAPANPGQQEWMKQRRQQVMLNALSNNGTVSLGSGRDLFVNLLEHLRAEAGTGTDNYRYQVLSQIPQVFRTAKERDIAYQAALRTHAFEQFPELLDNRQNNYGSLVSSLGQTVHDLLNTQTAVEFLVTRMENYPQRLEVQWQTSWQQHGYQLAHWREEAAGRVTNLEPRILAIVLKELRRDLTTRQQSNRVMYDIDQSHFWRQKADDFAATAESVLAETSSVFSGEDVPAEERPATSGKRTVVYVAQYLYDDLHRYDRAIEIMFVAHRHDLLDVSQQITLCQWLHWQNRHAESIALLEPIVETYPDQISYRTMLITAYNRSSRPGQRDRFLADTDAHFRRPGLWTETNIAALATCCEENQLDLQAIGYFDELIPLHQRTQPNRGIGNGTLSDYYRRQGRAYSRLGRTKEAVDAISAAVVSWGPRHDQRSTTVNELREVLRSANDLDEFASSVELDAEKSGMDSPLIRKQIGVVYRERNQPEKAVPHLQKALGLQPHDLETHRTLLECCDALENQSAATDQLLAMIEIDRRNLELYSRLAERLKDNPALSERAATSLVESGATEAENHQALAELRQKQNRWQDAIQHWQHVDRLRSLEPTGLVNLAKAQVHVKDWPAARKSLTNLNRKEWPSRFDHLRTQIQQLQNQLPD